LVSRDNKEAFVRIAFTILFFLSLCLTTALAVDLDFTWEVVEAPSFLVLIPATVEYSAELLQEIESVFDAVNDLWFPVEMLLQSSEEELEAEEQSGESQEDGQPIDPDLPTIVPLVIALYPCSEAMWRDFRRFDFGGLFSLYEATGMYGRLPEEQDFVPFDSVVSCCFPDGAWEATLVHELTHYLQVPFLAGIEDLPIDYRLFQEGMAEWTEFELVYGEERFDLWATQLTALWLEQGGSLVDVPEFVLYEIGASLVGHLCDLCSPAELYFLFLGMSLDPLAEDEEVDVPPFSDRFVALYGMTWEEFVVAWEEHVCVAEVNPGAHILYEAKRRELVLRSNFLRPLLSPEERSTFEQAWDVIWNGEGTTDDLDAAEQILVSAWAEPTEEILEALAVREESLRECVRERSGDEAAASILQLSLMRTTQRDKPEEYLRTFVEYVNTHLVWPAALLPDASRS